MNDDTKKLLKECNSGTKMAAETISRLLPSIRNREFKESLEKYRNAHISFGNRIHSLLNKGNEPAGDLTPVEKLSARLMIGLRLILDDSDKKIASMVADGCSTGIKSLRSYLNQYTSADKASRDIAENIIRLEESLWEDLKPYL